MSVINKLTILLFIIVTIMCNCISGKVFSSIHENRIIHHDHHASSSNIHDQNSKYLTHSNNLSKHDRFLTSIILEGDILVRKVCECKRSHMCMFHDHVKLTNKHRCQNGLVCCVTKSL